MSDNNKKDLSIAGIVLVIGIGGAELIHKGLDAIARKRAMKLALNETNKEGETE
ncbi:hypothetical protein MR857_07380 [bacterium]|nr:hypothetical protein [bacterium]